MLTVSEGAKGGTANLAPNPATGGPAGGGTSLLGQTPQSLTSDAGSFGSNAVTDMSAGAGTIEGVFSVVSKVAPYAEMLLG